jgi:hypothetical protein
MSKTGLCLRFYKNLSSHRKVAHIYINEKRAARRITIGIDSANCGCFHPHSLPSKLSGRWLPVFVGEEPTNTNPNFCSEFHQLSESVKIFGVPQALPEQKQFKNGLIWCFRTFFKLSDW